MFGVSEPNGRLDEAVLRDVGQWALVPRDLFGASRLLQLHPCTVVEHVCVLLAPIKCQVGEKRGAGAPPGRHLDDQEAVVLRDGVANLGDVLGFGVAFHDGSRERAVRAQDALDGVGKAALRRAWPSVRLGHQVRGRP